MAPPSALLFQPDRNRWLRFDKPVNVLFADTLDGVLRTMRNVEEAVRAGLHAAGFISYEAAPAFDPALKTHDPDGFPLVWFGLYPPPEILPPDWRPEGNPEPNPDAVAWSADVDHDQFNAAVQQIKHFIQEGDTYQVNYSHRIRTPYAADPWNLFLHLVRAQPSSYAAWIDTGRHVVCSASPELFFQKSGPHLVARPMKGTARRGPHTAVDQAQARTLLGSPKDRAENLMIVDMLRNDLGRVADPGSVGVPSLFDLERHPTVWQMTSTVTATTRAGMSEILAATFPCASVTGAPKARTMELISDLEKAPRHLYTGAIGWIQPSGDAQFSVAIRTAVVDRQTRMAEYGVGSGIVWDSDPDQEYDECRAKAMILSHDIPAFSLLETLRWMPLEGYYLLERHIHRLIQSAAYFGLPIDPNEVRKTLHEPAATRGAEPRRVRLLAGPNGRLTLEHTPLDLDPPRPWRVRLAAAPVSSEDPFLYHKTTHRTVYEQARGTRTDCDDVILWNERGELTESTLANLFLKIDGRWWTPPVDSGLLAGTYRAHLLQQGDASERILTRDDLKRCDALALANSVRGWWPAVWVE